MVKKKAVVIASVVMAGAVATMYVLLANMNIGVEGSGNSVQQPIVPMPSDSKLVKIVANSGSNSFNPSPVEIKVGETVTWVNDDSARHSVTSKERIFDSGILAEGQSFSHTFDKAGEYPYFCSPHPTMVGTVVVTES